MKRTLVLIYGVLNYLVFLAVFLYLIGFVVGVLTPTTVDQGRGSFGLIGDIALILLFGLQHSIMARPFFKKKIVAFLPEAMERSTYVLFTNGVLVLLFLFWSTVPGTVWNLDSEGLRIACYAVAAIGWATVLLSTFLIDHFDLFGLRSVYLYFAGKSYAPVPFKKTLLYRYIRHPLMLGFLLAFWSTPTLSVGHFVFSLGMSVYILIGIFLEERGLVEHLGETYTVYQQTTGKLFPKLR